MGMRAQQRIHATDAASRAWCQCWVAMPRATRRVLLTGKTAKERRGQVTRNGRIEPTALWYRSLVFSVIEKSRSWDLTHLDAIVCVNGLNCNGSEASQSILSPTLCRAYIIFGLKFADIWKKHGDFFRQGRKVDAPTRAPPLTALLARAIVCRAVQKGQLIFACLIAVGFHALLQTGEI